MFCDIFRDRINSVGVMRVSVYYCAEYNRVYERIVPCENCILLGYL